MSFTGNENHDIELTDAAAMTRRYREWPDRNNARGGFFGRKVIENILKQDDCVGIRYYFAMDENNVLKVVLVGVTEDENDIVNGQLAEFSVACPDICGVDNELNSDQ